MASIGWHSLWQQCMRGPADTAMGAFAGPLRPRRTAPVAPMGGMDLDNAAGGGADPPHRRFPARKHDRVNPLVINHGDFQVALHRRKRNRQPFAARIGSSHLSYLAEPRTATFDLGQPGPILDIRIPRHWRPPQVGADVRSAPPAETIRPATAGPGRRDRVARRSAVVRPCSGRRPTSPATRRRHGGRTRRRGCRTGPAPPAAR